MINEDRASDGASEVMPKLPESRWDRLAKAGLEVMGFRESVALVFRRNDAVLRMNGAALKDLVEELQYFLDTGKSSDRS